MPSGPDDDLPFGNLVSFCGKSFEQFQTGVITDLSLEWLTSFVTIPDAYYPADLWFAGPAPLKPPMINWNYVIIADCALSTPPAKQIQTTWNDWRRHFEANQKGDLVIADVDPAVTTTYTATARIMKFPLKMTDGANTVHVIIPITFMLLSNFTAA